MIVIVDLREEVFRRKNPLKKNVSKSNKDDRENLLMQITEAITNNYSEIVNQISRGEKSPDILKNLVEEILIEIEHDFIQKTDINEVIKEVKDTILGYGPLQAFVDDPEITDIFVNSPKSVFIRHNNQDIFVPEITFKDNNNLEQYIRSILVKCGQKIHSGDPLVDARDIEKHLRINAGIAPVAKIPYLAIRKHTVSNYTQEDFLKNETFTNDILEFMKKAILARLNIVIAGPTGSGKTTLLRFLANSYIPKDQRIVVLEEEEELKIDHPNMVALEAKKVIGEDEKPIEMDQLVKNSLRMAMRRIILGELRGREAFTLLRAFGTGHDGGMTTVHSNDTYNTIEQLAIMMLYANTPLTYEHLKMVISQSINLIIYMEEFKVQEITAVEGFDDKENRVILKPIYEREIDGTYTKKPLSPYMQKMFLKRGIKVE